MSEIKQSHEAKQKAIVMDARKRAEDIRQIFYVSEQGFNDADLFDNLANEIERLQRDIDTFRKLEGAEDAN